MQLNDYIPLAVRTESKIENVVFDQFQLQQLIFLSVRVTEVMDMVKKNVYYGKPIDPIKWRASLVDASLLIQDAIKSKVNPRPLPNVNLNTRLFHSAIGIFTEAGEMFDALFKNGVVDFVNFREEIGDVEWYQAIAYDALGADAEANLQNNIDKLTARYPNKFESARAINRDIETERNILEGKS